MLGFELKVEKWQKHGDSDLVMPLKYVPDPRLGSKDLFCDLCHHIWYEHGTIKRSGELICPGSWVLKDYDALDEGELSAN